MPGYKCSPGTVLCPPQTALDALTAEKHAECVQRRRTIMNKKRILLLITAVLTALMFTLAGCGGGADDASTAGSANAAGLEDGTYVVTFTTDNSMFHINEAYGDKALLTVEDGEMTVHITLASKKIVNLYPGLAEDAEKDGAELLEPTKDQVTYSDGYEEEVYGFDVPVPAIDEEFDLALIGTKGKWYDHKVIVSDPVPGTEVPLAGASEEETEASDTAAITSLSDLEDGEYQVAVAMEGGSGRASIASPAKLAVADGKATLTVEWSSENYDYMLVDGEKYLPVNTEGNSVFEIPVAAPDQPFTVIGDTTAMSQPHEIEYTLTLTPAE